MGNCADCVEYGNEAGYELQAYVSGLSVNYNNGTYATARSSNDAQDLALMKLLFTIAQGVKRGIYGSSTYSNSSIETILQVMLNNISSKGLITWYNGGNATVSYIMSKFTYTG